MTDRPPTATAPVALAPPTAGETGPSFDADAADRLRAAIGRLSRRLRPIVGGSGLTPSEISVLFTVVRHGPLGLSELAEREALNPTMLSRIVMALSELGLIRREATPEDRRAATVTATAAGRRMRARVHSERSRALGGYVRGLEEADRRALLAALPALEHLAAATGEPRP